MECRQLLSFCQACLSAGGDVREVGALGGWEKKIGASPAWISRGDPGGVCLGIDAAATPDRAQISVGGIAGAIRGSADRVLERAVGQMAYGLTVQSKSLRSLLAHLGVSFRSVDGFHFASDEANRRLYGVLRKRARGTAIPRLSWQLFPGSPVLRNDARRSPKGAMPCSLQSLESSVAWRQ